jgi:PAS domain S-box-containing protein
MALKQFLDSLTNEQLIDRLNLALDGAALGIWDWDLRDNTVQFDRRWCDLLGLSVEAIEMNLSTWESRVHPDDLAGCHADILAYLEGRTSAYENIHRMRHANGEWVYILDRGRVSGWDTDGRPIRFTGTHFDCTPTERAKRVLQHQRALLADLVRNLPSAVAMFDADDRYLAASDQWLRFYGLDGPTIVGCVHAEVGPPLPEAWAGPWREAKLGRLVTSEHDRIVGPDGRPRFLRWSMRPWRGSDESVAGLIVMFEDITESIEARLARERESRLSALGLMAGGVAHEINTPLQSMLCYAGMIEKSIKSAQVDVNFLHTCNAAILTTIEQIATTVDALRTVSRCHPSDPLIRVDAGALVQQIADLSRSRFRAAEIELRLELPGRPAWVMARPGAVGQILINLLNNAFDAVEGREARWVTLALELRERAVVLAVIDSGPGIPADILDTLMSPFCTTKPLGLGTGLGLSLSKSLAEGLGGALTHVAAATHTTFELHLPQSRDDGVDR